MTSGSLSFFLQASKVSMSGYQISRRTSNSGLFKLLDRNAYMQNPNQLKNIPKFRDWRIIDAQALITGNIKKKSDNKISVSIQLWDVYGEKRMFGISLSSKIKSWRRIAHIISDKIYERLTGEEGYFDTRIVYISESGTITNRKKRLAIVDQDGENHKFLTDGSFLALTPRFSPAAQEIAYLSFNGEVPRIFLLDLNTGYQKVLLPSAKYYHTSLTEAEMIKCAQNTMLASRVALANMIYDACEKNGLDYQKVKEIAFDKFEILGPHMTLVPGPDGERGFGGKCLPKDIRAFSTIHDSELLDSIIEYNDTLRNDLDMFLSNYDKKIKKT